MYFIDQASEYGIAEGLFLLKYKYVNVYLYQSHSCCQSVTGIVNKQKLDDISSSLSIQPKSHLEWDLYLPPRLHSQ